MRATSMAIGAILISAMGWASPGPTTAHPVGVGEQLTLFPAIFERTLPLLRESGRQGIQQDLVRVMGQGHEQAADWNDLRSPETYLGYARAERFASPARTAPDRRQTYTMSSLGLNAWSLSGDWVVGRVAVSLASKGGRIAIRFHARDLHLVMGSGVTGGKSRFRVSVDGLPPGSSHGLDVDEHGVGTLSDYRLYQLIRQEGPIKDHLFEIVFLDSGAEAFSFTFG